MKFYSLTLTREQLHQVAEGLGMRIDHMQENVRQYTDEELEAAKAALDHATRVADSSD